MSKVTAGAVSDRVLVGAGSTPCTLQFKFENNYATLLEKVNLSYKIKVTPPSRAVLLEGRRRRARACLVALEGDREATVQKMGSISAERSVLEGEIVALRSEVDESQATVQALLAEEQQLKTFVGLQDPIKFMSDKLFD
jgi:hypothetical protein